MLKEKEDGPISGFIYWALIWAGLASWISGFVILLALSFTAKLILNILGSEALLYGPISPLRVWLLGFIVIHIWIFVRIKKETQRRWWEVLFSPFD